MIDKKRRFLPIALSCCMGINMVGCASSSSIDNTNASIVESTNPSTETSKSPEAEEPEIITNYTYEELSDGNIKLTSYKGDEAEIFIPAEINGKKVTEVGDSCFAGNIHARIVHIPENVTSVGEYAFEVCAGLQKVYLPHSLKSLGAGAFSGCVDLFLADMNDGLESIGKGAFLFCRNLPFVEIPASVEEVGNFAFAWCQSLTNVKFSGEKLKNIPDRMFYKCEALLEAHLPNSVETIGKRAFSHCNSLSTMYLFENITDIAEYAFERCEKLGPVDYKLKTLKPLRFSSCYGISLNTGDTLEEIEPFAFSLTGVTEFTIASSVKNIMPGAFAESNVSTVYMFEENDYYQLIDGSLFTADGKTLLAYFVSDPYADEPETSYTVPDGVEEISAYAFSNCNLEEVTIPDSVKVIGEYAFKNSGITKLNMPEDVDMDETAIYGCCELGWEDPEEEVDDTNEDGEEVQKPEGNVPTIDEILADNEGFENYSIIPNEEFEDFSKHYMEINQGNSFLDPVHEGYISRYKESIVSHFKPIIEVQSNASVFGDIVNVVFGDDYEEMYQMVSHGLETEINRFETDTDMVLFSGLFDYQLENAAGTDYLPSIEELKACIGKTFTDTAVISTTTDPAIAVHFGSTMFIIYASAEAMNTLGNVCMDSYMGTGEKEILMNSGAKYRILDAGTMTVPVLNGFDETEIVYEDYVKVELLAE